MIVRLAAADDARAIGAAQRVVARSPGLLASRAEEIRDDEVTARIVALNERGGGIALVAEEGGGIVGHVLLQSYKLAVTAHVADITLVVHEGHQGRGIGKLLMQSVIERARSNGNIEKIELRVRATNARAIALYRSLGFVEEGRFRKRIKLNATTYVDDLSMALWVGAAGA